MFNMKTDSGTSIPLQENTHYLFFQFSCGHEYCSNRASGSVSDWENCLCDSCQPYHAIVVVNHPCRHCGGFFSVLQERSADKDF
jgi:hypothetical protein